MFGFGQQLVGMLAVDLDQQLAQLAQLRERDGGAVDEAARAAVGADHPAKQTLTPALQLILFQPALGSRGIFQREARAQVGTGGAATHHVGFRSAAEA